MSENNKKTNGPTTTTASPKGDDKPATRGGTRFQKLEDISTTQPDLSATLDHILTVGAKVRHDMFRQTMFAATQEQRLQDDYHATLDQPTTRPGAPPAAAINMNSMNNNMLDNHVHAEDVRIYGTNGEDPKNVRKFNGLPQYPWPSIEYERIPKDDGSSNKKKYLRPPKLTTDDTQWNVEHGDTIHPLAFQKARLSGVPLDHKEKADVDGNNMFASKTETAVEDAQVPRALLLRCWERAVHAASNTNHVPIGGDGGGGGGDHADQQLQQQQAAAQAQQTTDTRDQTGRQSNDVETTTTTQEQKEESQDIMEDPEQQPGQEEEPIMTSRKRDRPTHIGTGHSDQPLELEVDPVGTATAQSVNPVRLTMTNTRRGLNKKERDQNLRSYLQNIHTVTGKPRFGETAQDHSRTAALKKCEEWDIQLLPSTRSSKHKFSCQNCQLKCDTHLKLDEHFHGIGNQEGCCWSVVHKKQREKLDNVLQEHIKCHIQTILELVMSKAKEKNPPPSSGGDASNNNNNHHKKRARLINWYDILEYMESEYRQAEPVEGSPTRDHPVLETMEIVASPYRSPLVLNRMVLEALRRRLIERYADIPC